MDLLFWIAALAASFVDSSVPAVRSGSEVRLSRAGAPATRVGRAAGDAGR